VNSTSVAASILVIWCLLAPPTRPDGKIAENAPLSQWTNHHSFDSKADCEAQRREIINKMSNSDPDATDYFNASVCVSNDDPRLKEEQ
jgi:hypothetical protein